ncbi:MAG: XRE family transcriptional regulator [Alphaproteobacteria bacterium]|nr:XRE family transcriptional regulator [Alphaproteobacteria bacterium]MBU1515226.1 XRE family transcriptional regulator [Alphaproteobacteria bacterium]MBU2092356.1 XRE family transcriptional regulator [Alphaproteobacteria bacterium]MBU2152950.1 XRE family transcriptional regulator [Alphaproteobacteria bacterium]MBU2305781.1 XRE family transcriptional regulator [Alphaproteobacteria bacterium]
MSDRTGAAIRKLRLSRGWSLAALSEQSGVPISTLSRVELGQNALNYEKLMRLCRALEVDLEGLVTREAETAPASSGRRSVIRAGDGPPTRVGGNTGRRGADDLLSKSLSPIVIDVTARSLEAHGPLAVHVGEAYVLILDGQVEFHSHLYAPLIMRKGDGVYFDASAGYALIAPEMPAKVVLVAAGETSFDL